VLLGQSPADHSASSSGGFQCGPLSGVPAVHICTTLVQTGTTGIPSEPGGGPEPELSALMNEWRRLINLAYRLLGSLAEAEDAAQEAYARWYAMFRAEQDAIDSPDAWLTTVTSRICLDLLGSARARRQRYVGEWIPEPLPEPAEWPGGQPGGIAADPAGRVTLAESVSRSFISVRVLIPVGYPASAGQTFSVQRDPGHCRGHIVTPGGRAVRPFVSRSLLAFS
jgi:hypothetical protein